MYSTSDDDGRPRGDGARVRPVSPDRSIPRGERVQEIKRRVAEGVYRSAAMADEIARGILERGDL